jgi:hypothetical protein
MSANSKFYIPNCSSGSVVLVMVIRVAQGRCETVIQDGVKDGRQIHKYSIILIMALIYSHFVLKVFVCTEDVI